jgi:hypothetical protein
MLRHEKIEPDIPTWMTRSGYVLTRLVLLFFMLDATIKLLRLPIVIETITQLGWPERSAILLGVLQLTCAVLYAIPKTSVLGALLMTAYLGGAVATHVRIGSPLISHILFGVFFWRFRVGRALSA